MGQSGSERISQGHVVSALISSRFFLASFSASTRMTLDAPPSQTSVRVNVPRFSWLLFNCRAPGRFFLFAAVKSSARDTLEETSVSGRFLVDSETRPAAVQRVGGSGPPLAHRCRPAASPTLSFASFVIQVSLRTRFSVSSMFTRFPLGPDTFEASTLSHGIDLDFKRRTEGSGVCPAPRILRELSRQGSSLRGLARVPAPCTGHRRFLGCRPRGPLQAQFPYSRAPPWAAR